jgi:HK97 family phage major capsid protein
MDRKTLLATLKNLGADTTKIKNEKDAQAALTGLGYEQLEVAGRGVIDLAAAWKTVYINPVATAGEDVQMGPPPSEAEGASMDEPEAEREDEPMARSYQPKRANAREMLGKMNGASGFAGMDAKSLRNIARSKAYTNAARKGLPFGGAECIYADGERAEIAGATLRLGMLGHLTSGPIAKAYSAQRKRDEEIVTKAGTIGLNASYGALVVDEYVPELIENFNRHGAARLAAGVTAMARDSKTMPRLTNDVTVYDVAEGGTITPSDATVDTVSLYAKKTAALGRISNELLNDSALDIANLWSRSVRRAVTKFEDNSYINGQNNRPGLLTTTATVAGSTFDVASTTGWAAWNISNLQAAKAKLAAWALQDEELAIICHPAFYEAVLKVNAYSAGGTPGDAILNGYTVPAWDGVPVVFSPVMPSFYAGDQISAYIGAFKAATKFGVVSGSEELDTDESIYFASDEFAIRYTQRWDYNLHDVTSASTDGTGVVALKD